MLLSLTLCSETKVKRQGRLPHERFGLGKKNFGVSLLQLTGTKAQLNGTSVMPSVAAVEFHAREIFED
jgi:hypothetical protein